VRTAVPVRTTTFEAEPITANLPFVAVSVSGTESDFSCFRPVRQSEAGQRHAGKPAAEFFQRRAAANRLSHAPCEFIEFIIHNLLDV
jgi:hypothetical protein